MEVLEAVSSIHREHKGNQMLGASPRRQCLGRRQGECQSPCRNFWWSCNLLAIPWLCLPAGTCSLEGALYATPSATGAEQFGPRIAQGAVQASEQASGVSWTCRSGRPQALVRPALKVSEAQAGHPDWRLWTCRSGRPRFSHRIALSQRH